jgi:hypothetical protein
MQKAKTSAPETAAVQRIFNTATVTVGGLYLTTHSVTVTAIGTAASTIVECWFHARHGAKAAGVLRAIQAPGRGYAGTAFRPFLHHVTGRSPQPRLAVKVKAPRQLPRVLTVTEVQGARHAMRRRPRRRVRRRGPGRFRDVRDDKLARLEPAFACHCGKLRREGLWRARARLGSAGQRPGDGGDHAGRDREAEGDPDPVVERASDQGREEHLADQERGVHGRQARQQLAEQLLDGLTAEERGEQHADRRQVRQRRRRGAWTP